MKYSKKRHLSAEDYKALDELEAKISGECEEKEWEKLREVLKGLDTSERNTQIWKQMKRAYPNKTKPVPTGVMNIEGKVITNPKEKRKVILDHFTHRMRKRPVMDEIREISDLNEQLCQKGLKLAKNVRSQPFTIEELEATLKTLIKGKSRDPDMLVCDIFKEDVLGEDLKMSLLVMFNKMKQETKIPECIRTANITMIHKK